MQFFPQRVKSSNRFAGEPMMIGDSFRVVMCGVTGFIAASQFRFDLLRMARL
jgi:hypothetical protein